MSSNTGNIKILSCGYCTQLERLVSLKGRWRTVRFCARCFLVPLMEGFLLFDCGYGADTPQLMKRWPAWLYKQIIPVTVSAEQTAISQLARFGLSPQDIKYIFISHFHVDHIGGLQDFPHARFICSQQAYESLNKLSAFRQVCKGFISSLLPTDFAVRAIFVEQNASFLKKDLTLYNLPDLPDMYAVSLPGHAAGHLGLWLAKENILLAADAAWQDVNLKPGGRPSSFALYFCEDKKQYLHTLQKLSAWTGRILFTHEEDNVL